MVLSRLFDQHLYYFYHYLIENGFIRKMEDCLQSSGYLDIFE